MSRRPDGRVIIPLAAEKELKHIGETSGCADHDHDLGKRLDVLWRYDQYIANAAGKPGLQVMWRDLKNQEAENIHRVKQMIAEEVGTERPSIWRTSPPPSPDLRSRTK